MCSRQKHYDHRGIVYSSGNQECDHLILKMQDSTGAFELTANRMCVCFSLGDTSTARVLFSRIHSLLAHQFSVFCLSQSINEAEMDPTN